VDNGLFFIWKYTHYNQPKVSQRFDEIIKVAMGQLGNQRIKKT